MKKVNFTVTQNNLQSPLLSGVAQLNPATGEVILPKETEAFIAQNWNNGVTEAVIEDGGKKWMLVTTERGWVVFDEIEE